MQPSTLIADAALNESPPAPLGEEHMLGWRGRLLRLSGRPIPEASFVVGPTRTSHISELAALAKMSVLQFARAHSVLPYVRMVVSDDVPVSPAGRREFTWANLPTYGSHKGGPRFCSECAREDRQIHGIAYWRRSHQLPGFFWCTVHRIPLTSCENPQALAHLPGSTACRALPDPLFGQSLDDMPDAVKRYVASAEQTLSMPHPIGAETIRRRLSGMYLERHPLRHRVSPAQIQEDVQAAFPQDWLALAAPQRIGRNRGKAASDWYTVFTRWDKPRATERYLIALTALSDSVTDALTRIYAPETDPACDPSTPLCRALEGFLRGDSLERAHLTSGVDFPTFERALRDALRPALGRGKGPLTAV